MNRNRILAVRRTLAPAALGLVCAAAAAGAAPVTEREAAQQATNSTVITSQRLTFDYAKQVAVFDENVQVTDTRMGLKADRMVVQFDKSNRPRNITATGRVQMLHADKWATCEKVVYDVAEGKMVMTGSPVVRRGRDLMSGTVITYWRDQNRVVCEPARLVFYPEGGSLMPNLFKE